MFFFEELSEKLCSLCFTIFWIEASSISFSTNTDFIIFPEIILILYSVATSDIYDSYIDSIFMEFFYLIDRFPEYLLTVLYASCVYMESDSKYVEMLSSFPQYRYTRIYIDDIYTKSRWK